MFSAQQKLIELDPGAPTTDINADSGGIQARRIVDKLYREEQAARGDCDRRGIACWKE